METKILAFLALGAVLAFLAQSAFSEELRGDEPGRTAYIEGFSEAVEPVEAALTEKRFSGETKWRFKSDKPNAETFGSAASGQFVHPLYLYNRTSLVWNIGRLPNQDYFNGSSSPRKRGSSFRKNLRLRREQSLDSRLRGNDDTRSFPNHHLSLDWVLLRRDETSSGGSEPSATWPSRNLFLRHAAVGWKRPGFEFFAGDILIGWGQSLAFAQNFGAPFRPFLWKNHAAEISPNRSSYENTGLRGLAAAKQFERFRVVGVLSRTTLHGRLSSNGGLNENYSQIADASFGEFGSASGLSRRNALNEELGVLRVETEVRWLEAGLAAAYGKLSRPVRPEPSVSVDIYPNRWDQAFQGDDFGIVSADLNALFDGRSRLAFEAAMSAWSGHKAPAAVLGFEIKKSSIRNLFGVFYLSPHYVSRLADAVRYGDEAAGNRWGGFGAFESRLSRHAPGGHFYWERNIKTMFSGSSLSHQPPDSRSRTKLRLDDRILLARAMSLYGRGDLEFEPYFVHAIKEPRVSRIEERKLRLEWSLDKKQWSPAVGFDYLRALAHGYPSQSSEAKDVYFKLRFKPAPGLAVYAKTAYFDVGPALFNSRFLYLSSPELYWRRLTLSSIAYQSLFASYAPRGLRAALAVEQQWDEHLSFWLKWGDTWLDHENASSMPINTAERDDLIAASRWDFKMEVTCKW